MRMMAEDSSAVIRTRYLEILGCTIIGSIGILIVDAIVVRLTYYSDEILVLYPVAVQSLTASLKIFIRPYEYFIVLAANKVYLPLWLGASLLCVIGATILSALACEKLFERQLPKTGWWILGLANPLLFYLLSQSGVLSQALFNILLAGAMLAFISEWYGLRGQSYSGWRADHMAVLLNMMAAALLFTKELALAAAVVLPAATALIRFNARRLSPIFLFSLLLPIGAVSCWIFLKLKFPASQLPGAEGHYSLKLNPITWVENFITTLAFPITPLPSSFIAFEGLRPLWVVVALGLVSLFLGVLLRECLRRPKIILPLLVLAGCCAPMILIKPSEIYSTMIAPFAVSIVLLFTVPRAPRLSLAYGLLLYCASLGNVIIYSYGPDFEPFSLRHLQYSIYDKYYQRDPICPIGKTAHIAWDATASGEYRGAEELLHDAVRGQPVCVR
jgi:hypothetical protein